MTLTNGDIIIPGTNGLIFTINTMNRKQITEVVAVLVQMPEVKKVIFNCDVNPHLITVHASKLLRVSYVLDKVNEAGFQASQRY